MYFDSLVIVCEKISENMCFQLQRYIGKGFLRVDVIKLRFFRFSDMTSISPNLILLFSSTLNHFVIQTHAMICSLLSPLKSFTLLTTKLLLVI